jgi:hypothetical protein
MFKIFAAFLKLDIFAQSKQFHVSKNNPTFPSFVGVIFSIIVLMISLSYVYLRANILINHLDTQISTELLTYDVGELDVLGLTIADPDGYNF